MMTAVAAAAAAATVSAAPAVAFVAPPAGAVAAAASGALRSGGGGRHGGSSGSGVGGGGGGVATAAARRRVGWRVVGGGGRLHPWRAVVPPPPEAGRGPSPPAAPPAAPPPPPPPVPTPPPRVPPRGDDPYGSPRSRRPYQARPASFLRLAARNFRWEAAAAAGTASRRLPWWLGGGRGGAGKAGGGTSLPDSLGLVLSNEAVRAREVAREATGGRVAAPPAIRALYTAACAFIDAAFGGRPVARFYFLEVIARMPYFAYLSCLHLVETLGFWRSVELRMLHSAEELNEYHHLLIVESLGGNLRWFDRFLTGHLALAYYWFLVGAYLISGPAASYCFSELLEAHAVDTYSEFIDANRDVLAALPPPQPAVEYYSGCGFYFREFHTAAEEDAWDPRLTARPAGVEGEGNGGGRSGGGGGGGGGSGGGEDDDATGGRGGVAGGGGVTPVSRPTLIGTNAPVGVPLDSLLDVFTNIRDDEVEHVRTMIACQAYTLPGGGGADVVPIRVTLERRRRAEAVAAAAGGTAAVAAVAAAAAAADAADGGDAAHIDAASSAAAAAEGGTRAAGAAAAVAPAAGARGRAERRAQAELDRRRQYWKAWAREVNAADHASRT
ncbi:hypothetical protein I4F81_012010 [Pyropia yezoensis]|uniref:Uncharacterized protein n=1 Tax=Pyropia yezoensis TaxID=2788 RepID=A0ACC3CH60_PYRYE|nr:hypothetical protein I4F81_012010 [Neopyropia yezoensis]